MKVYYFNKDIRNVTGFYYDIMLSALCKNGIETKMLDRVSIKNLFQIKKEDYVLATSLQAFIKLWLWGHRNFIYWYQGITPEEDKMITGSQLRYLIFSLIEHLSLKVVKYKIGVSKYLFEHYQNKYGITIDMNCVYIMPCYNSEFHKNSFFVKDKYLKNVFCYAGGMQVWQGFENIVFLYKTIEIKYPDAFLRVYSKDLEGAREIIEKYEVSNYTLECVSADELESKLAECKFGFIIREDDIVNNVATPTKLATYIGNGVIPVFTPTIKTYADMNNSYKYLCCANQSELTGRIADMMTEPINAEMIFAEYQRLYSDYYDKDKHMNALSKFFMLS